MEPRRRVSRSTGRPGWTDPGTLIRYGHSGRPVLVFPSEQGRAWDYENNGMVGAVADLVEAGRVKLYCVDSFDHLTWSDTSVPLEERARRHGAVRVVDHRPRGAGRSARDSPRAGRHRHHRLQPRRLPRAQLHAATRRPVPAGDLPVRQLRPRRRGTRGASAVTRRTSPTRPTTCRTSAATTWTGCAAGCPCCWSSARAPGRRTRPARCRRHAGWPVLLHDKGIPHEFDLWGHDVAHDWPWWQRQLAHHLPRFC